MINTPVEPDPDPEPDIRRFSSLPDHQTGTNRPNTNTSNRDNTYITDTTAAVTPTSDHGVSNTRIGNTSTHTTAQHANINDTDTLVVPRHAQRSVSFEKRAETENPIVTSGDDINSIQPPPDRAQPTAQDQLRRTQSQIQGDVDVDAQGNPIHGIFLAHIHGQTHGDGSDILVSRPSSNRPKVRDFAAINIAQPIHRATGQLERLVPAKRDGPLDIQGSRAVGGGGVVSSPLPLERTASKIVFPNPSWGESFRNTLKAQPMLFAILVLLPISWGLEFAHQDPVAIFVTSLLAIVPLAGGLGFATEELAHRMGDAWGGLLNATFGNTVELLIAILALVKGDIDIVQASMVGSILSNVLLVLGMSYFAGGLRFHEQLYGIVGAQMHISLLGITLAAIVLPAAYHYAYPSTTTIVDQTIHPGSDVPYGAELDNLLKMSRGLSFILLSVYGMFLTFQLWTHAYLFRIPREPPVHPLPGPQPTHDQVFPRPNWVPSIADSSSASSVSSHSSSTTANSPFRRFRRWSTKGREGRYRSDSDPSSQLDEKNQHLRPQAQYRLGEHLLVDEEASIRGIEDSNHFQHGFGAQDSERSVPPPQSLVGSALAGVVGDEDNDDDGLGYIPPIKVNKWFAWCMLTVMTALAGVTAEWLVESIDGLTETGNISREFVGLILLPVIGNSVEHITAVTVSVKDKLNLSMSIAVGSSIQISLCILPILVLIGWAIGQPMILFFDTFETITLVISVLLVNFAISDGRTNYLEGFVMMMAYVSIALVCWFYDPAS